MKNGASEILAETTLPFRRIVRRAAPDRFHRPDRQGAESGMTGRATGGEELAALKFGYPSACELEDGALGHTPLLAMRRRAVRPGMKKYPPPFRVTKAGRVVSRFGAPSGP